MINSVFRLCCYFRDFYLLVVKRRTGQHNCVCVCVCTCLVYKNTLHVITEYWLLIWTVIPHYLINNLKWFSFSGPSGGGDHFDHRPGVRSGIQKVPRVRRERRRDTEADRKLAEKSKHDFRKWFCGVVLSCITSFRPGSCLKLFKRKTDLSSSQIQELETENSELKKQLQALEEQLVIAQVPPVRSAWSACLWIPQRPFEALMAFRSQQSSNLSIFLLFFIPSCFTLTLLTRTICCRGLLLSSGVTISLPSPA